MVCMPMTNVWTRAAATSTVVAARPAAAVRRAKCQAYAMNAATYNASGMALTRPPGLPARQKMQPRSHDDTKNARRMYSSAFFVASCLPGKKCSNHEGVEVRVLGIELSLVQRAPSLAGC